MRHLWADYGEEKWCRRCGMLRYWSSVEGKTKTLRPSLGTCGTRHASTNTQSTAVAQIADEMETYATGCENLTYKGMASAVRAWVRQLRAFNSASAPCQCELTHTSRDSIMKCIHCGREYPVRNTVTTP